MRYADLNLSNELILGSLVVVVWAAFLMRAAVFFRLERAGIGPLYPDSWNVGQRRALERFRLLIGLALVPLWAIYLSIAPSIPANSRFGNLEMPMLISMLSASYAWILLLAPRNWKRLDALPRSFMLMIAFLVLWWATAFSALGWMFATASAPPSFRMFSNGVYAGQDTPHAIPGSRIFVARTIIGKMNKAAKRNMIA